MVLIKWTFCQIQRSSPHAPLGVRYVCALIKNKQTVFVFVDSSVNAVHCSSQSTHCFKSTEWKGVIVICCLVEISITFHQNRRLLLKSQVVLSL